MGREGESRRRKRKTNSIPHPASPFCCPPLHSAPQGQPPQLPLLLALLLQLLRQMLPLPHPAAGRGRGGGGAARVAAARTPPEAGDHVLILCAAEPPERADSVRRVAVARMTLRLALCLTVGPGSGAGRGRLRGPGQLGAWAGEAGKGRGGRQVSRRPRGEARPESQGPRR